MRRVRSSCGSQGTASLPIDYYAVCETHKVSGPAVSRCPDPDHLRWFLTHHSACDVRIYSEEHDEVFNYPRWTRPAEGPGTTGTPPAQES
jgi:hypothetical protein